MNALEAVWVEKYRPRKLDEIVGQKGIVERLKGYVASGNLPNMLFAGPPGTGKTTAALAITSELYGPEWRNYFLELNASDERGIDVVRNQIKSFARTRSLGGEFKIIFLDEADALTRDAQHALRRTMEMYTSTCRFILSCNYSSKIIEPIQSRCALFRFRPLSSEDITSMSKKIAHREGLELTHEALQAILYNADGDLRRAINLLQSAAAVGREIDEELIFSIVGRARPQDVKMMLQNALDGDYLEARNSLRELVIAQGVSGEDLVGQIHRETFSLEVPDEVKLSLIDTIGEYDFRIREGASELIQLEALLAQFAGRGVRA